jgi:2,4-dienoyl-CoA reductase-like NADH-dependent reductase (Old Yellow Enzyme family)
MSLADIDDAVEAFVRGAKLAKLAGFDGIQLHAAHGCECFFCTIGQVSVN